MLSKNQQSRQTNERLVGFDTSWERRWYPSEVCGREGEPLIRGRRFSSVSSSHICTGMSRNVFRNRAYFVPLGHSFGGCWSSVISLSIPRGVGMEGRHKESKLEGHQRDLFPCLLWPPQPYAHTAWDHNIGYHVSWSRKNWTAVVIELFSKAFHCSQGRKSIVTNTLSHHKRGQYLITLILPRKTLKLLRSSFCLILTCASATAGEYCTMIPNLTFRYIISINWLLNSSKLYISFLWNELQFKYSRKNIRFGVRKSKSKSQVCYIFPVIMNISFNFSEFHLGSIIGKARIILLASCAP